MAPPSISKSAAAQVTLPSTRFGQFASRDRARVKSTVNWQRVACHEPHNVANWLAFLYTHEYEEMEFVLYEVAVALNDREGGAMQWPHYAKTDVPSVLIDILCDSDMFVRNHSIFKVRAPVGVSTRQALNHARFVE